MQRLDPVREYQYVGAKGKDILWDIPLGPFFMNILWVLNISLFWYFYFSGFLINLKKQQ
jgi:ABC-type protease/lipase transport system fused ATPase/permease subunit